MSETPRQHEADDVIRKGYEKVIKSIRDDVWMQLNEGVESGYITNEEATEYYEAWKFTFGVQDEC